LPAPAGTLRLGKGLGKLREFRRKRLDLSGIADQLAAVFHKLAAGASLTVGVSVLYACKVLKETGGLREASNKGVSRARHNGRKNEIRFKGNSYLSVYIAWD
jgi:hypothetical protein